MTFTRSGVGELDASPVTLLPLYTTNPQDYAAIGGLDLIPVPQPDHEEIR